MYCGKYYTNKFDLFFISAAGLQTGADNSTLKWYNALQDSANQCAQASEDLSKAKDTQVRPPAAPRSISLDTVYAVVLNNYLHLLGFILWMCADEEIKNGAPKGCNHTCEPDRKQLRWAMTHTHYSFFTETPKPPVFIELKIIYWSN